MSIREAVALAASALLLCTFFLVSCDKMYLSIPSRGGTIGTPGAEDGYSQPGTGKYPPNTGGVRVFSSMEELKNFIYEPLSSLTETNRGGTWKTRADMLSTLQYRAAKLGANAIAIVKEEERAGEIWRIRANAVRIIREKEQTY